MDRSKYRKASSEEMEQVANQMESRKEGSSSEKTFLKVEPGINKFRIFPAPLKAKRTLFAYPKVVAFLPLEVDEYVEGKATGNKIVARKAVFNAKVHGAMSIDVVEAYIEAAKEKFSVTCKDKKELLQKLKPITDWKTGIKYSTSYICHAIKYKGNGENKQYGKLQLTEGVKKQLDALCLREGSSGTPITVDLFSDPDNGKPFQWISNPNAEDAKQKNKISMLYEEDLKLTDEELEMLEGWDSLENLYCNSFKRSDFEKQVEGLQRFDQKNNLGIFDTQAFQSILETAREEVEAKFSTDEEKEDSESSKEKVTKKNVTKSVETDTIPSILQDMEKKDLLNLIKEMELEIEVKSTTPPSKIRTLIKKAIVENYELEGEDDEINSSIEEIISQTLENNEEESEEVEEIEEEVSEEVEEDSNEEVEEEPEEEETPKKKVSLLDKYKKKKA